MEILEHFRYILLVELFRGTKLAEEAINIYAVYGDNAIGESTTRKWFRRSNEERFDISDTPHSGIPSGFIKIV